MPTGQPAAIAVTGYGAECAGCWSGDWEYVQKHLLLLLCCFGMMCRVWLGEGGVRVLACPRGGPALFAILWSLSRDMGPVSSVTLRCSLHSDPTGRLLLCRLKPCSQVSCSVAAEPTGRDVLSCASPKRPGPTQRAGSLQGSSFLIVLPRLLCQGQPGGRRFNELLFHMTSSIIGKEQTGGGLLKQVIEC